MGNKVKYTLTPHALEAIKAISGMCFGATPATPVQAPHGLHHTPYDDKPKGPHIS